MVWVITYGSVPALRTGFVMSVTEKDGYSEDKIIDRGSLPTRPFAAIGRKTINWVNTLGAAAIFLALSVLMVFRPKQWTKVVEQDILHWGTVHDDHHTGRVVYRYGLRPAIVPCLGTVWDGSAVGTLVALSLIRELGPSLRRS